MQKGLCSYQFLHHCQDINRSIEGLECPVRSSLQLTGRDGQPIKLNVKTLST
jgi:hypothetical protein